MSRASATATGICCAEIRDAYSRKWRLERGESVACTARAAYEIDGKPYCHSHAPWAALKLLLEETERNQS